MLTLVEREAAMGLDDEKPPPLDYHSPPNSPFDPDINSLWWVRMAYRRRRPLGCLRVVYLLVTLGAIAWLLWYIRSLLAPYNG